LTEKQEGRLNGPDVKLSERLSMVAALAGDNIGSLADVGCDHGWLGISLLLEGKAGRVIGMDLRKGPLSRADENALLYGLTKEQFETRLSDGLEGIAPGEADVIVMAGIGGVLMCRILTQGLEAAKAAKRLVLSPQSHIESVRELLAAEGFRITDERMCRENGKYYTAMCVSCPNGLQSPQDFVVKGETPFDGQDGTPSDRKCETPFDGQGETPSDGQCGKGVWALKEEELFFGPVLIKRGEPLFYEYVRMMRDKARKRIGEINGNDPDKEEYFKSLLMCAEKVLSKLEKNRV